MRTSELVKYKKDTLFEKRVLKGEYDDFFDELDLDKSEFDDDLVDELDENEEDDFCGSFGEDDLVDELDENEEDEIEDPLFQAYKRAEMEIDEDGEFQYNDGFHEEEY